MPVVTPSSTPSGQPTLDPCALLSNAEVTSALKFEAPTPERSSGGFRPNVDYGRVFTCMWLIPFGKVPTNRLLTLEVSQAKTTLAQFDVWAKALAALQGVKATRVPGVGERAYLLGFAFGIVFRQHGVDLHLSTQGVPGLDGLPSKTLDANAKPYYSNLANKVIARVP